MDQSRTPATPTPVKFSLGHIVATSGAIVALVRSGELPGVFLERHVRGDWGTVQQEDWAANDEAVAHEGDADRRRRVLSAYETKLRDRIWIITEWDRSATTILLPNEY